MGAGGWSGWAGVAGTGAEWGLGDDGAVLGGMVTRQDGGLENDGGGTGVGWGPVEQGGQRWDRMGVCGVRGLGEVGLVLGRVGWARVAELGALES